MGRADLGNGVGERVRRKRIWNLTVGGSKVGGRSHANENLRYFLMHWLILHVYLYNIYIYIYIDSQHINSQEIL
jgi:hypothetical protein